MNKHIGYMTGVLILLGNIVLVSAGKDDTRTAYEIYRKCFNNNSVAKEIKEQRDKLLKQKNDLERENKNGESTEVFYKIDQLKNDIKKLENEEFQIYKNCIFSKERSPETIARVLKLVDEKGPYNFPAWRWRNSVYDDFSISKIQRTQHPNMKRREEAEKCLKDIGWHGNVAATEEHKQLYTKLSTCLHRNWIFTSQDRERVKEAQELTIKNPVIQRVLSRIESDINIYDATLKFSALSMLYSVAGVYLAVSRDPMQPMNGEQPSQGSE